MNDRVPLSSTSSAQPSNKSHNVLFDWSAFQSSACNLSSEEILAKYGQPKAKTAAPKTPRKTRIPEKKISHPDMIQDQKIDSAPAEIDHSQTTRTPKKSKIVRNMIQTAPKDAPVATGGVYSAPGLDPEPSHNTTNQSQLSQTPQTQSVNEVVAISNHTPLRVQKRKKTKPRQAALTTPPIQEFQLSSVIAKSTGPESAIDLNKHLETAESQAIHTALSSKDTGKSGSVATVKRQKAKTAKILKKAQAAERQRKIDSNESQKCPTTILQTNTIATVNVPSKRLREDDCPTTPKIGDINQPTPNERSRNSGKRPRKFAKTSTPTKSPSPQTRLVHANSNPPPIDARKTAKSPIPIISQDPIPNAVKVPNSNLLIHNENHSCLKSTSHERTGQTGKVSHLKSDSTTVDPLQLSSHVRPRFGAWELSILPQANLPQSLLARMWTFLDEAVLNGLAKPIIGNVSPHTRSATPTLSLVSQSNLTPNEVPRLPLQSQVAEQSNKDLTSSSENFTTVVPSPPAKSSKTGSSKAPTTMNSQSSFNPPPSSKQAAVTKRGKAKPKIDPTESLDAQIRRLSAPLKSQALRTLEGSEVESDNKRSEYSGSESETSSFSSRPLAFQPICSREPESSEELSDMSDSDDDNLRRKKSVIIASTKIPEDPTLHGSCPIPAPFTNESSKTAASPSIQFMKHGSLSFLNMPNLTQTESTALENSPQPDQGEPSSIGLASLAPSAQRSTLHCLGSTPVQGLTGDQPDLQVTTCNSVPILPVVGAAQVSKTKTRKRSKATSANQTTSSDLASDIPVTQPSDPTCSNPGNVVSSDQNLGSDIPRIGTSLQDEPTQTTLATPFDQLCDKNRPNFSGSTSEIPLNPQISQAQHSKKAKKTKKTLDMTFKQPVENTETVVAALQNLDGSQSMVTMAHAPPTEIISTASQIKKVKKINKPGLEKVASLPVASDVSASQPVQPENSGSSFLPASTSHSLPQGPEPVQRQKIKKARKSLPSEVGLENQAPSTTNSFPDPTSDSNPVIHPVISPQAILPHNNSEVKNSKKVKKSKKLPTGKENPQVSAIEPQPIMEQVNPDIPQPAAPVLTQFERTKSRQVPPVSQQAKGKVGTKAARRHASTTVNQPVTSSLSSHSNSGTTPAEICFNSNQGTPDQDYIDKAVIMALDLEKNEGLESCAPASPQSGIDLGFSLQDQRLESALSAKSSQVNRKSPGKNMTPSPLIPQSLPSQVETINKASGLRMRVDSPARSAPNNHSTNLDYLVSQTINQSKVPEKINSPIKVQVTDTSQCEVESESGSGVSASSESEEETSDEDRPPTPAQRPPRSSKSKSAVDLPTAGRIPTDSPPSSPEPSQVSRSQAMIDELRKGRTPAPGRRKTLNNFKPDDFSLGESPIIPESVQKPDDDQSEPTDSSSDESDDSSDSTDRPLVSSTVGGILPVSKLAGLAESHDSLSQKPKRKPRRSAIELWRQEEAKLKARQTGNSKNRVK